MNEPGCGLERQPQLCSTFLGAVVSGLSREGVDLFCFHLLVITVYR